MKYKTKTCKALSLLLISGMLVSVPNVRSEAAVITSNATDKIAVTFQADTDYSAGDYVIYDGEMYICTVDSKGPWDTAEPNFMQVTKNHALGSAEDLSASYDPAVDPSNEKSLMAFAANVWQKLKAFLGMDSKDTGTDADHYKTASVSAKLNYLEEQNQTLHNNVTNLKDDVNKSFTSVSNGKTLLAGAITDKGGTANPSDTFPQFSQSIKDLAQLQYNAGYDKGHDDGYNTGHDVGYSKGHDDGYSAGHDAGYTTGRSDGESSGYDTGYHAGIAASDTKTWSIQIRVDENGPDKERECFSVNAGSITNSVQWAYSKSFEGHTILSVYAEERYHSAYGDAQMRALTSKMGSGYKTMSNMGGEMNPLRLGVSADTIYWGKMSFSTTDPGPYSDLEITVVYI